MGPVQLGCGAGNTVYPVLESDPRILVACCDFSHRAVQLVRQHPQYDPERVNAFQCDITAKDLTVRIQCRRAGDVAVFRCAKHFDEHQVLLFLVCQLATNQSIALRERYLSARFVRVVLVCFVAHST